MHQISSHPVGKNRQFAWGRPDFRSAWNAKLEAQRTALGSMPPRSLDREGLSPHEFRLSPHEPWVNPQSIHAWTPNHSQLGIHSGSALRRFDWQLLRRPYRHPPKPIWRTCQARHHEPMTWLVSISNLMCLKHFEARMLKSWGWFKGRKHQKHFWIRNITASKTRWLGCALTDTDLPLGHIHNGDVHRQCRSYPSWWIPTSNIELTWSDAQENYAESFFPKFLLLIPSSSL